jgi:anaerobic selenocysteine-containing dehydrogenase
MYTPIWPRTDIAFLSGLIRYLLDKDKIQHEYVKAYTNASLIVKEEFGFVDGLFSRYTKRPGPATGRAGTTNSMSRVLPTSTTAGKSALRHQPAPRACRALYARNRVAHLRYAAGKIP